jgi:hypothetical protein
MVEGGNLKIIQERKEQENLPAEISLVQSVQNASYGNNLVELQ